MGGFVIVAAQTRSAKGDVEANARMHADCVRMAVEYRADLIVFRANHSAPTGAWTPAGKSAIWDEHGDIVTRADGTEEALVIAEKTSTGWQGRVVRL